MLYPLAQAAPANPDHLRRFEEGVLEIARSEAGVLILWFVLSQSVAVLACWAASRAVNAGENGTLLNAIKVYFYSFVALFILGAVFFVGMRVANNGAGAAAAFLIFSLTAIYLGFVIPMRVYDIGVGRAFGWMILSVIFQTIGGFGLSLAFNDTQQRLAERFARVRDGSTEGAGGDAPANSPATPPSAPASGNPPTSTPPARPVAERPRVDARPPDRPGVAAPVGARKARFDAQERIAGDKSRPQAERLAALTDLYQQLEQERVGLPPGDAAARTAFDQRRARYDAALQKLRAEQPTPKPTPRPAK